MTTPADLPQTTSVVIIGGGMAGLSCAAALARHGIGDVVLLEAKTLAHAGASSFGETWRVNPCAKRMGSSSMAKAGMKKPSRGRFPVLAG
jgi:glycine/D-amino acid oxidase-like deaminating enzyme